MCAGWRGLRAPDPDPALHLGHAGVQQQVAPRRDREAQPGQRDHQLPQGVSRYLAISSLLYHTIHTAEVN